MANKNSVLFPVLLLVLLAGGASATHNSSDQENKEADSLTVVPREERESDDAAKERETTPPETDDEPEEEENKKTESDDESNSEKSEEDPEDTAAEEEDNDESDSEGSEDDGSKEEDTKSEDTANDEDDHKEEQNDDEKDDEEPDQEKDKETEPEDESDSEKSEEDPKDTADDDDKEDSDEKDDEESDQKNDKENEPTNDTEEQDGSDSEGSEDDGSKEEENSPSADEEGGVGGLGGGMERDEEKESGAPAPEGKVLIPGDGFAGETPQPAQIGDEDAQAIARWDVVPFQSFSGKFNVGVVAFHKDGIDRVEFSVDGGSWVSVSDMTVNPRTGVKEYWAALDASKFSADGPVEVRAVVYPNKGTARVLAGDIVGSSNGQHSVELVANASGAYDPDHYYVSPDGSDEDGDGSKNNPYRTVWKASAVAKNDASRAPVVYLQAGTYDGFRLKDIDSDTWVTVTRAPGLSRNDVIITDHLKERFSNNHLRVSGVRFELPNMGILFHAHSSGGRFARHLWMDDLDIVGDDRSNSISWSRDVESTYVTNSSLTNNVRGFPGEIVRDVSVSRLGEDAYTNARLLINATVEDVNRDKSGVPDAHPDVYQLLGSSKNQIAYGVTATKDIHSQGFFMGGDTDIDIALVDIELSNRNEEKDKWWPHSLTIESADHVVIKDSWFHGRVFGVTELPVNDIYIENTRFGDSAPYRSGNWDYDEVVFAD